MLERNRGPLYNCSQRRKGQLAPCDGVSLPHQEDVQNKKDQKWGCWSDDGNMREDQGEKAEQSQHCRRHDLLEVFREEFWVRSQVGGHLQAAWGDVQCRANGDDDRTIFRCGSFNREETVPRAELEDQVVPDQPEGGKIHRGSKMNDDLICFDEVSFLSDKEGLIERVHALSLLVHNSFLVEIDDFFSMAVHQ